MHWLRIGLVMLGLAVAGTGCSDSATPADAGTDAGVDAGQDAGIDAGQDAGLDADGGVATMGQTHVEITSGGGQTASPNFKARVQIGAPQPFGTSEGAGKKLQVGPNPKP